MPSKDSFVCKHLENISRSALDEYQEIIRRYVRRRQGVYALYRRGNPDPNAAVPLKYFRDVTSPQYQETWPEGLNVFDNHNARFPLDETFFPHCMNHWLKNKQIVHSIPDFHPFTAGTVILSPRRIEE